MDDPVEILRRSKRIAVVGASGTPGKDAHEIPKTLAERGYDIIPVNPRVAEAFGRKAYPTLADVPGEIDVVNVFRPSEEAAGVVRDAIARGGVKAIWLQTGVASEEAARAAKEAGIAYVEDTCIRVIDGRVRYLDGR